MATHIFGSNFCCPRSNSFGPSLRPLILQEASSQQGELDHCPGLCGASLHLAGWVPCPLDYGAFRCQQGLWSTPGSSIEEFSSHCPSQSSSFARAAIRILAPVRQSHAPSGLVLTGESPLYRAVCHGTVTSSSSLGHQLPTGRWSGRAVRVHLFWPAVFLFSHSTTGCLYASAGPGRVTGPTGPLSPFVAAIRFPGAPVFPLGSIGPPGHAGRQARPPVPPSSLQSGLRVERPSCLPILRLSELLLAQESPVLPPAPTAPSMPSPSS